MGVDASYLYGYGADVNEIEWDIEFLYEKYKDRLKEKFVDYEWRDTIGELIYKLEQSLVELEEDECSDSLVDVLENMDKLFDLNYDDEIYLTFDHTHIANMYPDAKISELDEYAKLYAKELGIKNVEDIKWIEWGYFS